MYYPLLKVFGRFIYLGHIYVISNKLKLFHKQELSHILNVNIYLVCNS